MCSSDLAANCTVTGSANFGSYNPLTGQQVTGTGTIAVTCTGTANETINYSVALTSGYGSYSTRNMSYGGASMTYNLYLDSSYLQIWGDGTGGTSVLSDTMTLVSTSLTKYYTIYGRINSNQRQLGAGNYGDSITITLNYN